MSKWQQHTKEVELSVYFSEDQSRKAILSQDKYHYICRLYDISSSGILREYDTVLLAEKSQSYCEDLCENFVKYIGSYKIR